MIPRTIRWRLPLSYAAIALIATLALGAVLLLTLRSYYEQNEREYLENNARAISALVTRLNDLSVPGEDVRAQLQNVAFLSQVRIQLLDSNRTIVSDTGNPNQNFLTLTPGQGIRVLASELPPPLNFLQGDNRTENELWVFTDDRHVLAEPAQRGDARIELVESSQEVHEQAGSVATVSEPADLLYYVPARRSLFGFNLNSRFNVPVNTSFERSGQVVEMPLPPDNPIAKYVVLSQGPAYGTEIVNGVARGWFIASAVAIALAALIGLIISRQISVPLTGLTQTTLRMAEGDLSARALVSNRDEVGTLAHSFNTMAERVEETVNTLRRFVADAAHELHTPLTALRTNIELISEENTPTKRQLFMKNALVQLARLETLTSDLLELSRIESSRAETQISRVNLNVFLTETSELYASQAEQADIDFQIDLPSQTIIIEASESQVRRALCNLLDNTIKFTPRGGTIQVGLCLNDDHTAEIWVQDTGIGIPEDDMPQLFSRFHRGRNAYAYPGSGLGLAIVKAIADAHMGSVTATNTSTGTRLSLRLPVQSKSLSG